MTSYDILNIIIFMILLHVCCSNLMIVCINLLYFCFVLNICTHTEQTPGESNSLQVTLKKKACLIIINVKLSVSLCHPVV